MDTVHLVSDSRGYDGALVSLADAATVCAKLRKWFVVGGHMVNLHILRAGLDLPLRLTRDADIAVEGCPPPSTCSSRRTPPNISRT